MFVREISKKFLTSNHCLPFLQFQHDDFVISLVLINQLIHLLSTFTGNTERDNQLRGWHSLAKVSTKDF